jgi:hypothetical protein
MIVAERKPAKPHAKRARPQRRCYGDATAGAYERSEEAWSAAGAMLQSPHARDEMRRKSPAVKRRSREMSLFQGLTF